MSDQASSISHNIYYDGMAQRDLNDQSNVSILPFDGQTTLRTTLTKPWTPPNHRKDKRWPESDYQQRIAPVPNTRHVTRPVSPTRSRSPEKKKAEHDSLWSMWTDEPHWHPARQERSRCASPTRRVPSYRISPVPHSHKNSKRVHAPRPFITPIHSRSASPAGSPKRPQSPVVASPNPPRNGRKDWSSEYAATFRDPTEIIATMSHGRGSPSF